MKLWKLFVVWAVFVIALAVMVVILVALSKNLLENVSNGMALGGCLLISGLSLVFATGAGTIAYQLLEQIEQK